MINKNTILVVDDDFLLCMGLERIVSSLGLFARTSLNGSDALREIRRAPFASVFLDIHLPDANGLDLLPEIKRISPGTKVIMMSGDSTEKNWERAMQNGADYFLPKPFDVSEIRSLIRGMIDFKESL